MTPMSKRLLVLLMPLILAGMHAVQAQQPKKVPRIGYLAADNAATQSARAEGIRLALRERGYIEGQNIATEYRYAEGKLDHLPALAADLVRLKVDIIVTGGARRSGQPRMRDQTLGSGITVSTIFAGFVPSLSG